jgi:ABC-type branched-subunit amino acid transport system substrate-binding protein
MRQAKSMSSIVRANDLLQHALARDAQMIPIISCNHLGGMKCQVFAQTLSRLQPLWVGALLTTAHAADIKIAVAGPMIDGAAAIGVQMKAGVTASVDALNASGALLGAKVKLVVAEAGQKLKHTRPVLRADSAGDVLV